MNFEEKDVFQSLYFLELPITREKLETAAKELLADDSYGHIFRIKGFLEEDGSWIELNATQRSFTVSPIPCGLSLIHIWNRRIRHIHRNSARSAEILLMIQTEPIKY